MALWPASGSSPLARGTPLAAAGRRDADRFIPARAGNTPHSARARRRRPVHPRSRGEHCHVIELSPHRRGSSPLARGTPDLLDRPLLHVRFIPARAGNTAHGHAGDPCAPVHPRSRGEHRVSPAASSSRSGSSPLARGTRRGRRLEGRVSRFIPARAGNTPRARSRNPRETVHPRSRGEHFFAGFFEGAVFGSSPLARGTPSPRPCAWPASRFIPARAGNTANRAATALVTPVHPRSRGEHAARILCWRMSAGSSPLARGTRVRGGRRRQRRRFIPARAGNTHGILDLNVTMPVHPRSRGEHEAMTLAEREAYGSSPLARGTLALALHGALVARFIPARAGNTAPRPDS